jgi:hypothetical protein
MAVTINRLFSKVLLASLATFALGASCYNPKILPGTLKCNKEYDEKYECPEGFYCLGGVCQKGAPVVDSGTDQKVDMKVDLPAEKPVDAPMDLPTEPMGMCYQPVPGCAADAGGGKCDPFCQSGCGGCKEKCSVNGMGALTCNPLGEGAVKQEGQGCNVVNENQAAQTDNCAPGLVCVVETCSAICARFCRVDADCSNGALCNRAMPGGLKTCGIPVTNCNPVKAAGPSGCVGNIQGCYLSSTVKDRTVCDCSILSLPRDASCSVSRDCLAASLVCADASGSGLDLRCRVACSLIPIPNVANGGCPTGYTCRSHLGSEKYGYCN